MLKNQENSEFLSDLKAVAKTIEEIAVDGADRNLKLSEYYILGFKSQN